MANTNDMETRLNQILLNVQKPGRYVGGEYNQVLKNWDQVETRVALIFPDIYDIGLPNLGMAILYNEINSLPDALCERAYSPWTDMEAAMREKGIPLFTLESKHFLADFDIVGFSIPYETLYTNVLNALDLAGLPLFSSKRDEKHPLIIAGGHSAFNPEPMAEFIDAFVIGDGEGAAEEVIRCYQSWKSSGRPRSELLHELAHIPGIYIPSLYRPVYHPDGCVETILPISNDLPGKIVKRLVPQLPPPVTRFLVPNIDVVHNRVAVEIMRGCTRGCRFCHAGIIGRPVRERPVEEILNAIETSLEATGYEEIALLSLSSSDYTQILNLVQGISARFANRQLAVSLPSLRIESFSVELMDKLQNLRPGGGFTIAPEAATDRMRRIINKPVNTEQLIETAQEVFSHGWTTIKLYFMIGHPSETLDDVRAIVDVCNQVMAVGRRIIGGRARVNVGVSTFIPKPHTPFQWTACDSEDQIRQKLTLLKQEMRDRSIKLSWTEPSAAFLEACLSRGDRRIGQAIFKAWQMGCKFDAWQDMSNHDLWRQAFQDAGLDMAFYSHRSRSEDEVFPWDHISTGVSSRHLQREYRFSQEGRVRGDCREQCYACGILPEFSEMRLRLPDDAWGCPPISESPITAGEEV